MLTNANITLINEHNGKYHITHFYGVSWRGKVQSSISEKGLLSEKTVTIRIPQDKSIKTYIAPKEWQKLTEEQCSNFWTANSDKDFVIKGEVTDFHSITQLCKDHDVLRIYGFSDNTGPILGHWRIDCK